MTVSPREKFITRETMNEYFVSMQRNEIIDMWFNNFVQKIEYEVEETQKNTKGV